ncbi:dynein heavy chain 14, axonemal-like [Ochotona curzoniae]|uniref:dynein heavy chain 14, axonemal-like n=1 Tax=Ochotona curzoniae TaxID=130825 RepID=UPI001B34E805|nr:dynein heavy chain 14, axonemal-like [Ochotona curzoniae]
MSSAGFKASRSLSGKLVSLCELAHKQLSQKDHYDFGLRFLKTVLAIAEKEKQQFQSDASEAAETLVITKAIREASLPKFPPEDIPLFEMIIGDIFPSVTTTKVNPSALEKVICVATQQLNLQHWPSQKEKVIQFYAQLQVCVGVMLVGPTGGGKTTVRRILENALILLPIADLLSVTERQSASKIPGKKGKIDVCVLNPKCITLDELYGRLDPNTMEWTDGLLSAMIRSYVYVNTDLGPTSRISDVSNSSGEHECSEEVSHEDEGFMGMSHLLQAHHAMERLEEFVCKACVKSIAEYTQRQATSGHISKIVGSKGGVEMVTKEK